LAGFTGAALTALFIFSPQLKFLIEPRSIEIKNTSTTGQSTNFWSTNQSGAVNFLLLGAPGEGNDAPDLTDTILVARLDLTQNKIFLFSLPRDLLVKIPDTDSYTRLNALYALNKKNFGHEFDDLIQKVQEITGLTLNHYVFVDLQTVRQLVDIFGGVNVLVAEDIKDTAFPGPNHSFQTFELKAGWRYLDGETALKYMRSRHSAGGDFDRIARQQEVLQALKQKVLALHIWDMTKLLEVYNTLSKNIKSDLTLWQIKNYWSAVKDIPGDNVIKNEISNQNLVVGGQMNLGGETASILKPKAGLENYEEIKNYISNIIK